MLHLCYQTILTWFFNAEVQLAISGQKWAFSIPFFVFVAYAPQIKWNRYKLNIFWTFLWFNEVQVMDVLMEITITFGANGFFFLEAEDRGTLL